jgi:L-arabinose isomerase
MNSKKAKIGVLGLLLEAYEPIFPGITQAQYQYVTEVLEGISETTEYIFPKIARNRGDIEELTARYNRDGLDGIVIFLLSYSQGQYLVHAMQQNRLPLALALIQPGRTALSSYGEWEYTVNQGIHGAQDNANCLRRAGIPCLFFAGDRTAETFPRFMADFAAAARTATAMRSMKIGIVGKLPGMGDVVTDDMAFYRKLGPEFVYDSIGTVQGLCAAVTNEDVAVAMACDREIFDIDPTMPQEVHATAARYYLGIKRYVEQNGYAGYTIHFDECGADGRFTQLPFLAASHLMAEGYGYAAEGDASTAALGAMMQSLCGACGFSEMYMMDFERKAILFCHAGEGNWALAAKKPFLMDRVFNEGGLSNPPTPVFTPRPGRAWVLSLVHEGGDAFKLVAAGGTILPDNNLTGCDMPYLFFSPDSGVEELVTRWLEEGGTHHEIIVPGEYSPRIRMLCKLCGISFREL